MTVPRREHLVHRKLLIGALAASATLALAGAAQAVVTSPDGTASLTTTATPSKAGTATKPKNVTLGFNLGVNRPGTSVGKIVLDLPKGLKFSGKGLKKCSAATLQLNGPSVCPAASKAGNVGSAAARIEPANTALNFNVYPFVGGDTKILFFLAQKDASGNESGIQTVVTGNITGKGRKLTITIPQELRQPLAGLNATLTQISATFKGKVGKHYVVSSTGCKGGKWNVKASLVYAARTDNPTPPAPQSITDPVSCSK
jgi:hypothetical protein